MVKAVPGIRIAHEAPVADEIQDIADENTAPTGRTWLTSVTKATGINIGDMASGDLYGLWVERNVVAGATSDAEVLQKVIVAFDAA